MTNTGIACSLASVVDVTTYLETEMKAIKIEANKAGKRYALVPLRDAFSVWAECTNYASGSYVKTWRYCEKGLSREAADALFARKVAGKAR